MYLSSCLCKEEMQTCSHTDEHTHFTLLQIKIKNIHLLVDGVVASKKDLVHRQTVFCVVRKFFFERERSEESEKGTSGRINKCGG